MNNYMYDKDFLMALSQNRIRKTYIRLSSFNSDGIFQESLEGEIQSGSVNIDGASSVRRTCSLSFQTTDETLNDYHWIFKTKIQIQIGLENTINTSYPSIIWFSIGNYILTSFSASKSTTGYNISISAKDKMCMLNGELGGTLPAQTDFGKQYIINTKDETEIIENTIDEIINEAVLTYGNERQENIILEDLEMSGLFQLEYRGENPIYGISSDGENILNIYPSFPDREAPSDFVYWIPGESTSGCSRIGPYGSSPDLYYYYVAKFEQGDVIGYKGTDLTYNGDLIENAGSTVTTVLDKIKTMLDSRYEYFYDLEGRFIFRKKYSQNDYSDLIQNPNSSNEYALDRVMAEERTYQLEDENMFTAISITPNIGNIKNDFIVRGTNKDSGSEIPIAARIAVDTKPTKYKSIDVDIEECYGRDVRQAAQTSEEYFANSFPFKAFTTVDYTKILVDQWGNVPSKIRIIKEDSEAGNLTVHSPDSDPAETDINTSIVFNNKDFSDYAIMDPEIGWIGVIYKMAEDFYNYGHLDNFKEKVAEANPTLFPNGITGYEPYYIDVYSLYPDNITNGLEKFKYVSSDLEKDLNNWLSSPLNNNFWFDFIDSQGEISRFSVKEIGSRIKVDNNSKVSRVAYPAIPNLIYYTEDYPKITMDGYFYIKVSPSFAQQFVNSSQGMSGLDRIEELINDNVVAQETGTLTVIPMYFLQPFDILKIKNKNGDYDKYEIQKISFSLSYNSTMSLTVNKIVNTLY